jgi:hypothetical protein
LLNQQPVQRCQAAAVRWAAIKMIAVRKAKRAGFVETEQPKRQAGRCLRGIASLKQRPHGQSDEDATHFKAVFFGPQPLVARHAKAKIRLGICPRLEIESGFAHFFV